MKKDREKKIYNLKQCRLGFLIGAVICFLGMFLAPPLVLLGIICLIVAFILSFLYKKLLIKPDPEPVDKPVSRVDKINEEIDAKYIFFRFKVAGVTFKNGRKTRQAILRAFKWGDEKVESSDFEVYEYEGKPAVYVKINDQVVGNIPSDKVSEFLELEKSHHRDNVNIYIYGGNKLDDGSRTNYGCEIVVRYLREEL